MPFDGDATSRIPALYFACAVNHVGAVRFLLERGADPNDAESIYHAAQFGHLDCLELLLSHGAKIGERHTRWGNTPLFFLAGHHDERGGETPLHTIERNGRCMVAAQLLIDHGADPLKPRTDGRSPYALAVRAGATDMLALLRAHMAETPALLPVDEFLGACMRGDEPAARGILGSHPNLMHELTDEDRSALPQAAGSGLVDAVWVMVSLGFDVAREDRCEGTPLHWAAWWGRTAVVKLLLEHGAPLNVRDNTYGSSPIAWTAHGSFFCRKADEEYCAIVEILLDAGADYETSVNKWGEPPTTMGSERVSAVFTRRAFGPDYQQRK